MPAFEEWKPIPGYDDLYEVSNQGRVRSLPREFINARGRRVRPGGKDRVLSSNGRGYLQVDLCRDGGRRTFQVHALVLLAFVGPLPAGMQRCHNNGVRTDNRLENLRYDTASENQLDKIRHGTDPNANKTHCFVGHPFDEKNTYHYKTGRFCRACRADRERRRKQKMRAARTAA